MNIPIAFDAWRFVIPLGLLSGFLFWVGGRWAFIVAIVLVIAMLFCLFFFRDFDRVTPSNNHNIYSPADGTILEIAPLNEGPYKGRILIRIFLSVFNGHVQRAPVEGKVDNIQYKKGVFLDARDPNAHLRNEQNELIIASAHGPVVVTQIAGLIARRIVCWVKKEQTLKQGERFGLIRFGSQVDVVLPNQIEPKAKVGDKVVGGETVLAEWKI